MANRSSGYDKCIQCTSICKIEEGYDLKPAKGNNHTDFVCKFCIGDKVTKITRRSLELEELASEILEFAKNGDYSNGNTHSGYDEGRVCATDCFKRFDEALQEEDNGLCREPGTKSIFAPYKLPGREE